MQTIESLTAGQLNKLKKDNPSIYRELMQGKSVNISNNVQTIKTGATTGTTTGTKAATVPRFRNLKDTHSLLKKWYEWNDYTIADPKGTKEWLQGATTDQELQDFFVWVAELLAAAGSAGLTNNLKRWKDYTHTELKAMQTNDPKLFNQLLEKERQRIRDKFKR